MKSEKTKAILKNLPKEMKQAVKEAESKRKVYVLLTRLPYKSSRLIGVLTDSYYTHASIGFEDDLNKFYTFMVKGFMVEEITRYVKDDREPYPCRLKEIEVSERQYNRIKSIVGEYIDNRDSLSYSKVGVVATIFQVVRQKKDQYTCSKFVAEVLTKAKIIDGRKDASLFVPKDFDLMDKAKTVFTGDLKSFLNRFVLPKKA